MILLTASCQVLSNDHQDKWESSLELTPPYIECLYAVAAAYAPLLHHRRIAHMIKSSSHR